MVKKSPLFLLTAQLLLIVLGITMLISIGPYCIGGDKDPHGEVKKQLVFLGIGLGVMIILAMVDYRHYQKICWWLFGLAVLLLIGCLLPKIGITKNGARRWLSVGGFIFQPSELAKIAGVVVVAAWCAAHAEVRRNFTSGFLYPLAFIGALVALIAAEVDLGNATLLAAGALAVLFAAGARFRYLLALVGIAGGGLVAAVMAMPERMGRVLAFLDLEKYKAGDGLQQWLSLIALGSGGESGVGLGNSRQKMFSLPYPNSDFILPIIGEELGLTATLLVVICFVTIAIFGANIALHAPDRFGKLLGYGLTCLIVFQALIHLGVTTALLPNKGMPLPFVSAGGTNLICLMASTGIVLNIYRQGRHLEDLKDPVLRQRKLTPASL